MKKAILLMAILFSTYVFGQTVTFSSEPNVDILTHCEYVITSNTGVMFYDGKANLVVNGKKVDAKEYDMVITIKAKKDLDKLMKLLKQLEKEGYEFELKVNEALAEPKYSIWGNRTELINTPLHQTPNKIVEGY